MRVCVSFFASAFLIFRACPFLSPLPPPLHTNVETIPLWEKGRVGGAMEKRAPPSPSFLYGREGMALFHSPLPPPLLFRPFPSRPFSPAGLNDQLLLLFYQQLKVQVLRGGMQGFVCVSWRQKSSYFSKIVFHICMQHFVSPLGPGTQCVLGFVFLGGYLPVPVFLCRWKISHSFEPAKRNKEKKCERYTTGQMTKELN